MGDRECGYRDIINFSREQLIDYHNKEIGQTTDLKKLVTERLRKTILTHIFKKVSINISETEAPLLLQEFNVKPHNGHQRRLGQLKTIFMATSKCQQRVFDLCEEREFDSNDVIKEQLKAVAPAQISRLLNMFKVKPHPGISRRRAQLGSLLQKNPDCQIKFQEVLHNIRERGPEVHVTNHTYKNDFFPQNMEEIQTNMAMVKEVREWRNQHLKTGNFHLKSDILPCPLLEAGASMHKELNDIKWKECKVCLEHWPDLEVGPKSGKCTRCANERLPGGIPQTFSQENDMYPGQQPECLKILNTVETAAISLICPVLSIYKLKYGSTGLKGHSLSFHQNIQEFINALPRRPEDLPIIVIKAPFQKIPLTANRFHILKALEFLKQNNPDYANIVIDMQSISMYPDNSQSQVDNLRYLDSDVQNASAQEPVPADRNTENQTDLDNHADLEDNDLVETVAPTEVPTLPVYDQIRLQLGVTEEHPPVMDWPTRKVQPASEWEPGYFSKSFPNLFPFGTGDITKARVGKNPEFLQYIRHLTRLKNSSFAADPRFILHAISMYRRHKALTLGMFS